MNLDTIENNTQETNEATVVVQEQNVTPEATQDVIQKVTQDQEVAYVHLHSFAQSNALKYGVELMGGFYHVQEKALHFADTEENWHKLIDKYAKQEVK